MRSPPTSPSCTKASATCWWCRPARSRSAARCCSCRPVRSSSRTARLPPRSDRSRWRARGRRCLGAHGITAGQVLVTLGDTEERRRYLNARSTIAKLLGVAQRAGDQRERHGGDQRDPLRRQRPPGRARRHHDERRSAGAAVRRRRAVRQAAGRKRRCHAGSRGGAHHARDRGHGRRVGLGLGARRHGDQDRSRQDRDHRRHAYGDRLRPASRIRSSASAKPRPALGFSRRPIR